MWKKKRKEEAVEEEEEEKEEGEREGVCQRTEKSMLYMKNYNHFNSVLTPQHLAIMEFRRQSKPGFLLQWRKELVKTL